MNVLRNVFNSTSARTLNFLRQNGQNALLNLTQPVDSAQNAGNAADISNQTTGNGDHRGSQAWNIPKSILDATILNGKKLNPLALRPPGSISPTTLKHLRRMQRKVHLVYLCKICNTRNAKEVSEAAYKSGVVILQCDGCAINHLICDNLGWFANTKGKNFDEILAEHGQTQIKVIKVNQHGELI